MCIFCEFIEGERKEHTNGLPFKILNEKRHSIAFLSIDFPKTADGHILVIPKKHYERLEEIPKYILSDMMEHISIATKIMSKNYDSCNVILNNGKEAGQTIFHTHFHIVPRMEGDNVTIEGWKRKKMDKKGFRSMIDKFKKEFDKI